MIKSSALKSDLIMYVIHKMTACRRNTPAISYSISILLSLSPPAYFQSQSGRPNTR